jgi:hypothetical protein
MKVKFLSNTMDQDCQTCFGERKATWLMVPARIFRGKRIEHFCNECKEGQERRDQELAECAPGSGFEVCAMSPLALTPEDNNPFNHDFFNMGTRMGSNLMIMHSHHDTDVCESIILVNLETGERVRIHMRKFATE